MGGLSAVEEVVTDALSINVDCTGQPLKFELSTARLVCA
jgi:hypothetical protein